MAAPDEARQLHSPLTPAMFHVLLALSDGDKHGYAVLKEVSEQTGGAVQLSTGTLYGIIKRLLNDGLIVEVRNHEVRNNEVRNNGAGENDDQRRRYYRLTNPGRQVAVAETRRMETLVARARSKRLIKAWKPA